MKIIQIFFFDNRLQINFSTGGSLSSFYYGVYFHRSVRSCDFVRNLRDSSKTNAMILKTYLSKT